MTVIRWGGGLGTRVEIEDDAGNVTRTERRGSLSVDALKIEHDKALRGEPTSPLVEVVRRERV